MADLFYDSKNMYQLPYHISFLNNILNIILVDGILSLCMQNIIAPLVLDLIVHYTESGWDEVIRLVEVIRLFFIVAYMLL